MWRSTCRRDHSPSETPPQMQGNDAPPVDKVEYRRRRTLHDRGDQEEGVPHPPVRASVRPGRSQGLRGTEQARVVGGREWRRRPMIDARNTCISEWRFLTRDLTPATRICGSKTRIGASSAAFQSTIRAYLAAPHRQATARVDWPNVPAMGKYWRLAGRWLLTSSRLCRTNKVGFVLREHPISGEDHPVNTGGRSCDGGTSRMMIAPYPE